MDPRIASAIIHSDASLRNISEEDMIEMLLVWGFAFELRAGLRLPSTEIAKDALERFIAHGLPFNTLLNQRLFDPTEVINFMKWLDLSEKDFFWSKYAVTTGQKLVGSLAKKINGLESRTTYTPSFHFARTFNLSDLSLYKKLRLRVPIGAFNSNPQHIKIDFDGVSNGDQAPSKHANYLQLDYSGDAPETVTIYYDCMIFQKANRWPPLIDTQLSPNEHHLYTLPTEGFIKVTNRVKELALSIAGLQPPEKQVHALWSWILDNMMISATHYSSIDLSNPIEWALDHGIVDCQLGSAVLISFCRALDITARLVGGYTLYSEAPSQHYWAQIWFSGIGWRSYDLLTWDLSKRGLIKEWQNIFEGNIDPRFITEIFPRNIVGNLGVPFPLRHHRLVSLTERGVSIRYIDANSGRLLFRDTISVVDQ